MKHYILLVICILPFLHISTGSVYAVESKVEVTEVLPGMDISKCTCSKGSNSSEAGPVAPSSPADSDLCRAMKVQERKYTCTVKAGFGGFQDFLAGFIKWTIYIAMLVSVLAVVALGIAWSAMGSDSEKTVGMLKKWLINILLGLVVIFFFQYILQILAPWVYI